jgi:hypothetical protein
VRPPRKRPIHPPIEPCCEASFEDNRRWHHAVDL